MKLPNIVTAWSVTHSRATYPHTDPRIKLFKQHLSFLRLILSLFLQEEGINKPIRIQIIKHYLDPVYVDRDYKLLSLCIILLGCLRFGFPVYNQMWFTSPGPTVAFIRNSLAWVAAWRELLCIVWWCSESTNQRGKRTTNWPAKHFDKQVIRKQTKWQLVGRTDMKIKEMDAWSFGFCSMAVTGPRKPYFRATDSTT